MMRVARRTVVAVAAAVFLMTGCGEADEGTGTLSSGGTASPTSDGTSPTSRASPTSPGSPASGASALEVMLTDSRIEMAETSLPAGTYIFMVEQRGQQPHALAIEGPGVREATDPIPPGGPPAELTVTLEPGSYDVWCPVGNHREMGMEAALEVS
jgi:plastocyanin